MDIFNPLPDEKKVILELLDQDEHYYGDFGKQFLSNSDIKALREDPKRFKAPVEPNIHLLMGGAFHTMVLEPHKFEGNYPVIDASSRQTTKYKKEAGDDMVLLTSDMELLISMKNRIEKNEQIQSIIQGDNVEYEVPAFGEICGEMWKGKADVVNHDDKLVIDVKTTSDLNKFHLSAKRYNYDSQAFIYKEFFGYDFVFVVIDKKTLNMGFYDCSSNFYKTGREKVIDAVHAYRMYWKDQQDFDWDNYLLKTETL